MFDETCNLQYVWELRFTKTTNYVKSHENRWLTWLCSLGQRMLRVHQSLFLPAEFDSDMYYDPVLDRGIREYVLGNGSEVASTEIMKSTLFHSFVVSLRIKRLGEFFARLFSTIELWTELESNSIFRYFCRILYIVVQRRGLQSSRSWKTRGRPWEWIEWHETDNEATLAWNVACTHGSLQLTRVEHCHVNE